MISSNIVKSFIMNGSKQTPILIVDDYAIVVRIIQHHLKQIGFDAADSASNGAEALEKLSAKRYDLIISDWHMEPITGFQLLRKVRADPDHADVPFIMATIESRPQYLAAARDAGVTDYILKPFNAAVLRSAIAGAFAGGARRSQNFQKTDHTVSAMSHRNALPRAPRRLSSLR